MIALTIMGLENSRKSSECIIDTGFTDFLTIPPAWVEELGLERVDCVECELADGSTSILETFELSVKWDDTQRQILAIAADGGPLVGMAMMKGYRLTIDVRPGGEVLLTKVG